VIDRMTKHCGCNTMVIGITGGVGSGKSSAADIVRNYGFPVIDADKIARDLMVPGQKLHWQVIEEFGDEIVDDTGALDREKLGHLIFSDDNYRRRLDAITHPVIVEQMKSSLDELMEEDFRAIVSDVPLLYEVSIEDWFDEVWVIWCDRSERLRRLTVRDEISEGEAMRRLRSQIPLQKKVKLADRVIDNSKSLFHLKRQINCILKDLKLVNSGLDE